MNGLLICVIDKKNILFTKMREIKLAAHLCLGVWNFIELKATEITFQFVPISKENKQKN